MRRFVLILTLLSVPGWSQPAQQSAQPPIVVKVEMPAPPPRDFLGILQALGPFIAASVAMGVGIMQYYLQSNKSKQDLFDKRFHVYEAALDYLGTLIATQGNVDDDDHAKFRRNADPGEFMFGTDVLDFLVQLRKLGVTFDSLHREHKDYVAVAMAPDQMTRINLLAAYCVEPEDLTDPDELNRQYQNIRTQIPILEKQIRAMFLEACRMSEQSGQVFRPYLQLHYDQSWPMRVKARIDRWMESEVPAKFACKAGD